MFGIFKVDKEKLKKEYESIEKAQKLLDDRYEKKVISFEVYQSQSAQFSKKKDAIRKKLGVDKYDL